MSNIHLKVWTCRHENTWGKGGISFTGLTFAEAWNKCQEKMPNQRGFIISPEGKNITLGDGRTAEIEAELERLRMSAQPAL